VLGSTGRYSASEAALINGTLIHSIEFDDTHTGSVMHGSSALAPAVLAAAQQSGADGKTMLNGFVAGWETIIRMGLAAVVADVNGNRTRPWGIDQVVGKFTKNAELGGLSEQNIDRILEAFLETANPNIDILTDLVTT
jgi:2-methylcitrate dehydratase PrpD